MSKNLPDTHLVSVILPAFNGERFLYNTINSVLSQSLSNWELLIVDDGSTDATASICDEFAEKDSRVKVYHQPNGGVNSARAKGIENATGDCVTFLDADDTLLPHALEYMTGLFKDGIDIVANGIMDTVLDKERYISALWKGEVGLVLWGKMFRSSLLKKDAFQLDRRIVMGEDLLLNSIYALNISSARIFSETVYDVNHDNEASVTRTFKHYWDYEKYYFSQVEELFLSKCTKMSSFEDIQLLVNKSKLNAIKYVMLDGGRVNYSDTDFKAVRDYFKTRPEALGPSEKLLFCIQNPRLYRMIMHIVMKLRAKKR